jgi:hypothetical protein
MSVSTVAELRRLHVVGKRGVVHHPACPQVRRTIRSPLHSIGDDRRYWEGELRTGECCHPIVPRPDAPDDGEGWRYA